MVIGRKKKGERERERERDGFTLLIIMQMQANIDQDFKVLSWYTGRVRPIVTNVIYER
jgi:hypothetical protein